MQNEETYFLLLEVEKEIQQQEEQELLAMYEFNEEMNTLHNQYIEELNYRDPIFI